MELHQGIRYKPKEGHEDDCDTWSQTTNAAYILFDDDDFDSYDIFDSDGDLVSACDTCYGKGNLEEYHGSNEMTTSEGRKYYSNDIKVARLSSVTLMKDLPTGTHVSCVIDNQYVEDATINQAAGEVYICQNKVSGANAHILPEHEYSWVTEQSEPIKKYSITIKKGGHMATISPVASALLDAPTQTLMKANFLEYDMTLSNLGRETLIGLMFADYKDKMVVAAEAKIAETEKSCK